MKSNTSWGGVANWYDEHLERDDTYHEKVILPNLLRLLDIKKKDDVLDLACGQGFFAREYANLGGTVTAADISPELVEIAKKKGGVITYHVASADKLGFLKEGSIDKGAIVLALQNIENYQAVLAEISRILKQEGKFYLVLNHPAFRIPKESDWGWDDKKTVQYRREDRYLSELRIPIEMNPGKKGGTETISFHRPLQSYFKALTKAGLVCGRIEEWVSHKRSDSGPKAAAENRARAEFPLFMAIELLKK